MRTLLLLSLVTATASFAADQAPAGVDALSPDDVSKAIEAVKESFVRPETLTDAEMARATLQGLLDRLAPEVSLVTGTSSLQAASPFYSELYQGRTGYLRLGEMTAENVAKTRAALKDWSGKDIAAVVLDLRGTPASSDYDTAADLARLFCAKGTEMFSLAAGKGRAFKTFAADSSPAAKANDGMVAVASSTIAYSAEANPLFQGILIVLADWETAEAPEAVAASLQKCAKALVVGDKTAGRAFEFRDFPLDGAVLRVAVARVILPDGKEPGEEGLRPDIDVPRGPEPMPELMRSVETKGVASVIEEHDLPHLNEAALVAGSNPEVDELEAEASGKKPDQTLIDRQLQRALDLVTSISVYQGKEGSGTGAGE